jgi:hypothetical protein
MIWTMSHPCFELNDFFMCGRAKLSTDFSEIKIVFNLPPDRPLPNFQPTWNLAPTDPIPIVRRDATDGLRRLDVVRWGLLPFWAKDAKLSYLTFNARAEEVDQKPVYRGARQLLRVEANWATGKATLCDCAAIRCTYGDGRALGALALANKRDGAERNNRNLSAQPDAGPAAQPHARHPTWPGVVAVAG